MLNISILGCGWLGLPLAKDLMAHGYAVNGSTTSPGKLSALSEAGIRPFLINLSPSFTGDSRFFDADVLIINIPPRNREGMPDFHQRQLLSIRQALGTSPVSKVLFISSTAVYLNLNRTVTEADASSESLSRGGVPLVQMENIFKQASGLQTTVLRFGGLYGPDRHPGRFLAGKQQLAGAQNPVNMIHLEDCLGVIHAVIDQGLWGETFSACSPHRLTRKEFYTSAARELGLDPPTFSEEKMPYKEVSVEKLLAKTGYQFRY